MSNTAITDMIEAIEHFAQTQPDFPVYNVLGQVHTYGDLKADSDALAAKIDSLGLLPAEIFSSHRLLRIGNNPQNSGSTADFPHGRRY